MDLKTQHTPPTVGPFSLPLHVFLGWKRAGNAKGLKTDAEIAAFLVQLYEDGQNGVQSAVECPSCNSPLSLYCTKCQLQPQIPISSTAHSTADPGSENDIRKETFDRPSDGETLASPSQTGSFREADNLSLNESTEKDGDTPASQPEDKFFVLSDPNDSNDAPWVESTLDTDELSVGDFKEEPLAGVDSTKKSSFDPSWVKLNLDTGNVPVDDVKKEPDSSAVKKAAGSNNVSPTRQARKGLKKLTSTKKRLKNATSVVRSKTKVSLSQQKIDEQKDKDGTVSTKQRSPKDKFVCKELGCSEVCHSYAEFVEHRKTHNSTTPYRCPECGLRFAVRDALTMHVRIHYKCDECNVSYCCRKNIKRHMISKHINKDANIIQCQECGLTFTHKNGFHAHMKLQHSKEHKCSECGKTYEDPVALKWHMTEHAQCKLCGKTFFSKASLSCHMTNVHESASRHPKTVCHICGSRVTHMKAHMRIHTGEKPFKCDVCSKTFSSRSTMMRHRQLHTGDRPYRCHICGSTYKDDAALLGHLKVHKGDKPFKCTSCPKTFLRAYELKVHMRNHTGERPFECPMCNKKFKTSSEKICHIQRRLQNGETPCLGPVYTPKVYSEKHRYECPVCHKRYKTSSHLKQHQQRKTMFGEMPCFQPPASSIAS